MCVTVKSGTSPKEKVKKVETSNSHTKAHVKKSPAEFSGTFLHVDDTQGYTSLYRERTTSPL